METSTYCTHYMYVYHSYFAIVNGNWSEWKPEPCSKTCGGGVQNYTRVCDNPKPSCGGKECDGLAIYIPKTKCNNFCCPGIVCTYIHISVCICIAI